MVAENSGIKNKAKLLEHLYTNPEKLAMKLAKFTEDSDGNGLPLVKLKGTGQGYYLAMNSKKMMRVCRDGEFYLLPWSDPEDKSRCYIYTHHNWMTGCILHVYRDDIEFVGFN
jgi:hypothetical protein